MCKPSSMRRDPGVQLQLLDSIAGTSAAAAKFAQFWEQLQDLRQQLAAARQLADPAKRESMQRLVDQVCCPCEEHFGVKAQDAGLLEVCSSSAPTGARVQCSQTSVHGAVCRCQHL